MKLLTVYVSLYFFQIPFLWKREIGNIKVDFEKDMLTIQATQNDEIEEKSESGTYIRKDTGSVIRRQ